MFHAQFSVTVVVFLVMFLVNISHANTLHTNCNVLAPTLKFDNDNIRAELDGCHYDGNARSVYLGCSSTLNFTVTNTVFEGILTVYTSTQWWLGTSCASTSGTPSVTFVGNTFKKGVVFKTDTQLSSVYFMDLNVHNNIFEVSRTTESTDTISTVSLSAESLGTETTSLNFAARFTENTFLCQFSNAGIVDVVAMYGFGSMSGTTITFTNNNVTAIHEQYDHSKSTTITALRFGQQETATNSRGFMLNGNTLLNITNNNIRIASKSLGGRFAGIIFRNFQTIGDANAQIISGNSVRFDTDGNYQSSFTSSAIFVGTQNLLIATPYTFNIQQNTIVFNGTNLRMASVVRMFNTDDNRVGYNGAQFHLESNDITISGNRSETLHMGLLLDQSFEMSLGGVECHDFGANATGNTISLDFNLDQDEGGSTAATPGDVYLMNIMLPASRHSIALVNNEMSAANFRANSFTALVMATSVNLQNGSSLHLEGNAISTSTVDSPDAKYYFVRLGENIHTTNPFAAASTVPVVTDSSFTMKRNTIRVEDTISRLLFFDGGAKLNVGSGVVFSLTRNIIEVKNATTNSRFFHLRHSSDDNSITPFTLEVKHNRFVLEQGGGAFLADLPPRFAELRVMGNNFTVKNFSFNGAGEFIRFTVKTGVTIPNARYTIDGNNHECRTPNDGIQCGFISFTESVTFSNTSFRVENNKPQHYGSKNGGVSFAAGASLLAGSALVIRGNEVEGDGKERTTINFPLLLGVQGTLSGHGHSTIDISSNTVVGRAKGTNAATGLIAAILIRDTLQLEACDMSVDSNDVSIENENGMLNAAVARWSSARVKPTSSLSISNNPKLELRVTDTSTAEARPMFVIGDPSLFKAKGGRVNISHNVVRIVVASQQTKVSAIGIQFSQLVLDNFATMTMKENQVELHNVSKTGFSSAFQFASVIFRNSEFAFESNNITTLTPFVSAAENGNEITIIDTSFVKLENATMKFDSNSANIESKTTVNFFRPQFPLESTVRFSFSNNNIELTQTSDLPTLETPIYDADSKNHGRILDCGKCMVAAGSSVDVSGNTITMKNDLAGGSMTGIEVLLLSNRTANMVALDVEDLSTRYNINNNVIHIEASLPATPVSKEKSYVLPVIVIRNGEASDIPLLVSINNNEVTTTVAGNYQYATGVALTTPTQGDNAEVPSGSRVEMVKNTITSNLTGLANNASGLVLFRGVFLANSTVVVAENTVTMYASRFDKRSFPVGIFISNHLLNNTQHPVYQQTFDLVKNVVNVTNDSHNGTAHSVYFENNQFVNTSKVQVSENECTTKAISRSEALVLESMWIENVPVVDVLKNDLDSAGWAGSSTALHVAHFSVSNATINFRESVKLLAATGGVNPNEADYNDQPALAIAVDFDRVSLSSSASLNFAANPRTVSHSGNNTGVAVGFRIRNSNVDSSNLWFDDNVVWVSDRSGANIKDTTGIESGVAVFLENIVVQDTSSSLHVMHSNVSASRPESTSGSSFAGVLIKNVEYGGNYNFLKDLRIYIDVKGDLTAVCQGVKLYQDTPTSVTQFGTLAIQENTIGINYNASDAGIKTAVVGINHVEFPSPSVIKDNTIGLRTEVFTRAVVPLTFWGKLNHHLNVQENVLYANIKSKSSQQLEEPPRGICVAPIVTTESYGAFTFAGNNCSLLVSEGDASLVFAQLNDLGSTAAHFISPNTPHTGGDMNDLPVLLHIHSNIGVFSSDVAPSTATFVNATPPNLPVTMDPFLKNAAFRIDNNFLFSTGNISSVTLFDMRGPHVDAIETAGMFLSGLRSFSSTQLPSNVLEMSTVVQPFTPKSFTVVLQCSTLYNDSVLISNFPGATKEENLYCWTNTTTNSLSESLSPSLSHTPTTTISPSTSLSHSNSLSHSVSISASRSPSLSAPPTLTSSSSPTTSWTPSRTSSSSPSETSPATATLSKTPSRSLTPTQSQSQNYCDLPSTPHFTTSNELLRLVNLAPLPSPTFNMPTPEQLKEAGDKDFSVSIPGQHFLDAQTLELSMDLNMPLRNYHGKVLFADDFPRIQASPEEIRFAVMNITRVDRLTMTLTLDAARSFFKEDRTATVVVSGNNFVCPMNEFNLTVFIHFEKLPSPKIPAEVVDAVQITTTVTAVAAGIAGSPTQIMHQTKLSALMSLTYCSFDHKERLSVMTNPVQFSFGPTHAAHYRGSVIGSFMLLVGVSLFVVVVGCIVYAFRRKRMSNQELQKNDELTRARRTFAFLHLPGVLIVPFVLVTQGISAASIALFLHPHNDLDFVIGVFGLLLAWAPTILCLLLTKCWFRCELMPRHESDSANREKIFGRLVNYWFSAEKKWVDNSPDRTFKKHFLHIFQDYCFPHYIVVEITMTNIAGILEGIRIANDDACTTIMSFMVVIFFILLVLGLWLRPCLDRFNGTFMHLMNTTGFLAAAFLVAGHTTNNDDLRATEEWMSLAGMLLGVVKFIGDCVFVVIWLRGNKQTVTNMWKNFEGQQYNISEEEMKKLGDEIDLDEPFLIQQSTPPTSEEEGISDERFENLVVAVSSSNSSEASDFDLGLPPSHHFNEDNDVLALPQDAFIDDSIVNEEDPFNRRKFYRTEEGQKFLDEIQRGLAVGTFDGVQAHRTSDLDDALDLL